MAERSKPTSSPRTLALVVLAAGKGTRMKSARPKVLEPLCGRPVLWHVLDTARAAKPDRIVIVVGHDADDVRDEVRSWGLEPAPVFVEQARQLGTGHAVRAAERAVGRARHVLIANGDFDPVAPEDVRALVRTQRRSKTAATFLSAELDDPGTYGRVVRDGKTLVKIVEHVDATVAERRITEIATNWICVERAPLFAALQRVRKDNRKGEYYVNSIYPILLGRGERVGVVPADTSGAMGLNSRAGLAAVARVVRDRINERHMVNGVTIVDPDTTYIDVDVRIGPDTVIRPMTFLEGRTAVGRRCELGPNTRVADSTIGDDSSLTFAVAEQAEVGRRVDVGPFARLRPGTVLADGVHIGTSVEVKNSSVGPGSKVPHLTYLGDADVGRDVNVGAANVTANFDGYDKHRTVIEDEARTGSDTILVAPVRVGKGAVTGAGSVISKDVPAGALAVERTEQRTIEGYRKRKDAERARGTRRKGR